MARSSADAPGLGLLKEILAAQLSLGEKRPSPLSPERLEMLGSFGSYNEREPGLGYKLALKEASRRMEALFDGYFQADLELY